MRGKQARVSRVIAAALLGSDLSPRELVEVSERLLFDRAWIQHLSEMIREVAQLSGAANQRLWIGVESPQSALEWAVQVVDLLSRKRLRKVEALSLLEQTKGSSSWKPKRNRTLRQNAEDLLRLVDDEEEARAIVGRIAELLGYPSDPYLRELAR